MLRSTHFIALILTLMPAASFAFMCPTNFNQIDLGNSIDQVNQQCGKPDSQQESKKEVDNMPQEWNYYIPQSVGMNNFQQTQGTLKTSITFDSSGKAINISVNGIGVGASSLCGSNIQLGDTRDAVKAACGNPSFINKQNNPTGNTPSTTGTGSIQEIKVVTYIYNTNPPIKLIFENGVLKSRE